MKIQAILDGNVVTIANIEILGTDALITFTDDNNVYGNGTRAVYVTKKFLPPSVMNTITSAGLFVPMMIATSGLVLS